MADKIPQCRACSHPIDAHEYPGGECTLYGCSCARYEPVDPRDDRR